MKKFRIIALLFTCLATSGTVKAVVADPTPHVETLPDGRTVEVVLHGDEYHSYKTDLHGNIVAGHLPTDAELAVIHQRKAARKLGGHFPLKGTPHSLVILAEYPDLKYVHEKKDFEALLMESGYKKNGATGSCRDYFIACSDSAFQPIFDVYGPYEVSKNMSYYGENDFAYAYQLIIEACQLAHDDGVNFKDYDTDGDGVLDNVFVYYAGHNKAEGGPENSIWPHKSDLTHRQITIDGVQLASYACTSELKGSSGSNQCAIGTFCHEFGHVLGLPDWYDTSNNDKYTIGDWSIMSSGNYNNNSRTPPSYNAYERFFLGWLQPQQLKNAGNHVLSPLTASNSAYLIAQTEHNLVGNNPNPKEFFILENRQKVGWDKPYLPGTGMLVWHVEYKPARWNANNPNVYEPMLMHLEEAGGRLGKSSASDPYPGTKKITTFTPILHSGTSLSDQLIYNIQVTGSDILFTYKNTGEKHLETNVDSISITVHKTPEGESEDWQPIPVTLHGWNLSDGETFTVTTGKGNNFYLTQNESALTNEKSKYWAHTILLRDTVQKSGELDATFWVSYKTKDILCTPEEGMITIQSVSSLHTIRLSGLSPRGIYISTPIPNEEMNITPYSFGVQWRSITDAAYYEVEIYQAQDGDTTFTQRFEDFDDINAIHRQGWESTTTTLTSFAKKEGQYALAIEKTGDQITSPIYPASVTKVSFWVNAFSADVDSIGWLLLEASKNGEQWDSIETVYISNRTKDKTCSFALDNKKGYTQLRLTYSRIGGQGLALDAFAATLCEKIVYILEEHPYVIAAEEGRYYYEHTFDHLQPNQVYRYQIRCSDGGKGCSEQVTPYSAVRHVITLDGADPDGNRLTIGFNNDETLYYFASRVIYLPQTEEDHSLYIYELDGRLVWSTPIPVGQTIVNLPNELFTNGHVYMAKYMTTGKMSRKDKWVKFIYK